MNDTARTTVNYSLIPGAGLGVFWYVWGLYGFWWGVVYGAGWPIWAGYRLAAFLLPH